MNNLEFLKKDFEQNGYVILKNVFEESVLAKYRQLTDRIVEYAEKDLEDPFSPYYYRHRADQGVLFDLFQRHPEFQDLAKNKTILDFLATQLGEDIFLYENTMVYKPKNKNNEVPWHQDFIDRPNEPTKIIAWIALDNVTPENGAMKFVPGSHKLGFLPWYKVKGQTHHTRVQTDHIDKSNAVIGEMKAGDVLIFHQLLLHSSERISSDLPRRAYRVSYQGFGQIYSPRATPIVLRGGEPKNLEQKFKRLQSEIPPKSLIQRAAHYVGRRLMMI